MPDPSIDTDGVVTVAQAAPALERPADGLQVAETSVLESLFAEPDEASPDYGLLEQCDIDGDTRLKTIKTRLGDSDDLAAKTGKELMEQLLKGGQVDIASLRLQLTGREYAQIVTMLQGESLTAQSFTEALLANMHTLQGETSIFTNLGLERKTIEEGRRRMEGESLHVFTSAGLLALSADEMGKRQIAESVTHFKAANVGNLGSEFSEWYMNSLTTSLRAMDVTGMTEADTPTLQALKGDLFGLVQYVYGLPEQVGAARDPHALEGAALAYSKGSQAEAKLKEFEEARKFWEKQALLEAKLAQYKVSSFKEQADAAGGMGKAWFEGNQRGYINFDIRDGSFSKKLLSVDQSIWEGYFDSRQNLQQMMGVLLRMSDDGFISKAVTELTNEQSKFYEYMITDNVSVSQLPAEQVTALMRDKVERHVYATAFGFLRSAFEYTSPKDYPLDYINSTRLQLATTALTLVGKGWAKELLGSKPEQLKQLGFSESQIQFRQELEEYLKSVQKGTDTSKVTVVSNSIRQGVKRADEGVRAVTEQRENDRRLATEARQTMSEAEASLREAREQIYRKLAENDQIGTLRYVETDTIGEYIVVSGSGEARRLAVNSGHREALIKNKQEYEAKLQSGDLVLNERNHWLGELGRIDGQLSFMDALEPKLKEMEKRGYVTSGLLSKSFVYSSGDFPQHPYVSPPDTNEGVKILTDSYQGDSIPYQFDALMRKIEEVKKPDSEGRVRSTSEVVDLTGEINKLRAEIVRKFGLMDRRMDEAIAYSFGDIFSVTGPIKGLSAKRGNQYSGIVGKKS